MRRVGHSISYFDENLLFRCATPSSKRDLGNHMLYPYPLLTGSHVADYHSAQSFESDRLPENFRFRLQQVCAKSRTFLPTFLPLRYRRNCSTKLRNCNKEIRTVPQSALRCEARERHRDR